MRSIRKTALMMAAVAAATSILGGGTVHAAVQTWDGGAAPDANWSTAVNWASDVAPVSNDSALFDNTGVAHLANTVDTSLTLAKLTYQQDSSINPDGSYANAYVTTINPGVTLTLSADPGANSPAPANANLLVMPAVKALNGNTLTIAKIVGGPGSKLLIQDPSTTTGHAFNVGGLPLSGSVPDPATAFESSAILDMSALEEFAFLNNGVQNFTKSNFGIATGLSSGSDRGAVSGTVILGKLSTISGNRIVVGGQHGVSSDHNSPVALLLGGETTNINTTLNGGNFYVGRDPNIPARAPSGAFKFRPGVTDPTLNIGGPGSTSGFEVGNARDAAQSGTYYAYGNVDGTRASGTVEGVVNGNLASLRIGEGYNSGTNTGGAFGQFSISRGVIAANNGSMGRSRIAGASTTTQGMINIGLKPTGHASEQGGGAINFAANLTVGLRNAATPGINIGIVTLDNSGQLSVPQLLLGENSAVDAGAGEVRAIVNLNGGLLTTQQIKAGAATGTDAGTKSTRLLNFDGGTVKVASTSTFGATFLQGLTAATVYDEGATVDTNGVNVTIAQPLVAPTQKGLESITVSDGGSKYRAAPIVSISSDPTETAAGGGTAVATIDPTTGKVDKILITNPGSYTVLPTIRLIANGGDTAAGAELPYGGTKATFAGALTAAAPASGGFTKTGTGTLTLNGVNTYTGPTAANAGRLVLGKSLTTSSSVSAQNDATIELAADGSHNQAINTGPISIDANARIDLKDNKLLTTTPVGTFAGGSYSGVQGQIQRAYNFGSWDLPGLMTSMPDAGPLVGTTTIGVSDGATVLFLGPTETGTFAGQTVTGSTTIAMYTWAGDVNFDGLVDAADYGIIDNYFQFPGTTGYANGDFNYDGIIDAGDYGIIDNTFQLQGAPFPHGAVGGAEGLSGVTAVPEPASIGLMAIGAASLLGRRRRSR